MRRRGLLIAMNAGAAELLCRRRGSGRNVPPHRLQRAP